MVRARIMLCSSFLFTCSGAFGYHFGGLKEVPIGVMECRDRDRTGVHGILDDADEDIGRKVQPESARPRPRSALTTEFSSGAGCEDFMPRKAVMPTPSAATAGSACPWFVEHHRTTSHPRRQPRVG